MHSSVTCHDSVQVGGNERLLISSAGPECEVTAEGNSGLPPPSCYALLLRH